jgi:predicted amidohydrolase
MNGIEDQYGVEWIVKKGDPAYGYVMKLSKRGFRWVVLPEMVLAGIEVAENYLPLEMYASNNPEDKHLIRSERMNECLSVLRGER